jgi:tetratricopeptide (TPR) repeat protein/molecular chaperone GrpE (heat shock protein)
MPTRLTIFLLLIFGTGHAQTHRIDSLKKRLPSLDPRAQVDGFNALGWQYFYYWIHSDSALKYAKLAYQDAAAIHYNSGRSVSLVIQGAVQGRLLGQPQMMLRHTQQAIELLKNENDFKSLSMAYYSLAMAYSIAGKSDSAHIAADRARQIAVTAKDKSGEAWALNAHGFIYSKSGEYWKAFENLILSQEMGKQLNDSLLTAMSLSFIARSFNRVEDPQKALSYYHQSLQFAIPFLLLWPHLEDMGYAHLQLKQYDSALYYQKQHRKNIELLTEDLAVRKRFIPHSWGFSIEVQLARQQYDTVLAELSPLLPKLRQSKDVLPLMQSLVNLAKVYEARENYLQSLQMARELFRLASNAANKEFLKEGSELMAKLFAHLKQGDSAYFYYRQFSILKDSMETAQYAQRTALYLAASEADSKIRLLEKDKEITEQQLVLNREELKKKSQLKNWLAGSLAALVVLSLLVFRNITLKRKNEKLWHQQAQVTLHRKTLELEMQALRAQMNPHFIFNCLSAIDNLIQTAQADKATTYLSRFAKLIRGVLDSSKNNLVPFQKDFDTLRLYMELEQFRCNNKFDFRLVAESELLNGDYKVPPLIIQPFVENSIHHGLLNKVENNRQLLVSAVLENEQIIYHITDNGIGRKQAAILKERNRPGQQSYGIGITSERIGLYNKNGISNAVEICDLQHDGIAAGTEVTIRINSCET